jgi:PAS domain S-box-containing protein
LDYKLEINKTLNEDRYRKLIESLNVITYVFNLVEHRFTYVSRKAETILGYPADEWYEKGFWYDKLHDDDKIWASKFSREKTRNLEGHDFEYRMIAADGSVKWFKDITSVNIVEHIAVSLQGVLIDITDRKETEERLRETNERYKALVEQQTEMITRWLPDGTFTYVNDVFCNFFGKKRHELLGKKFIPDMPDQDKLRFNEFFSKLSPQNPVGQFTHRVFCNDGSIRWLRWTDKAITDNSGNIVEYQTVGRDITARMQAEDALRRSEENLNAIFENAPIGMSINSLDGELLKVNKAFCSMLGYSKEELCGMNFAQITHPEDLQKNIGLLKHTLEGMQQKYSIEKRYFSKDGTVIYAQLHVSIIRSNDGSPELIISQVIDITEKKKAEEKLRKTENRLGTLFDNLHDIVFYESGPEGVFITENISEMLGYTAKEISESRELLISLIHPDDMPKVTETFKTWAKIEENTFTKIEIRIRKKDGEYIWIEDRMFAIKTANRSYWAGFMIDITERKLSEHKLALTEHRLSSILNNLSEIVFYENEKELEFISENVFEMLGFRSVEFFADKGFFSRLVHPDDFERVYKSVNEWIENGEQNTLKSEFRVKKTDGSYIWVEDYMFQVRTDVRTYWAGFFVNVTDRKNAEAKLKETERRLTTIIDNLSNLTVYETGGGKNYVSENIEKLTGIPVTEFLNDNRLFVKLIHPDDLEPMDKKIKAWHKTGSKGVITNECRVKNTNGEYVWIEDHMFRVKNNKGEKYLSGIMIDITEQKKVLEKVHDTEIRLSTVLSNLPKIVIYQSGKSRDFISENIAEMIGYTPEEILKEKYFFGSIMHPDDIPNVKEKLRIWNAGGNEKEVLNMEYRLKKRDGDYIWIEDHMFHVTSPNNEPYLSGILIDITDRKFSEDKITQSLKEKEVLLKEIHHRVKNNLQVVSSLLKLQSRFLKDSEATNILLESQNRVRSMALVHQKLYQSKDFANVDFADYVNQLTMNLMDAYKYKTNTILLNIKADKILIGMDVAIPCGLIINELISNSLKYAFDEKENGKIDIILKNCGNDSYSITIRDNGAGFPKDIDFRDTKTLGMQLVNTLVCQIDGKIEKLSGKGTAFEIIFKNTVQSEEGFAFSDN